MNFEYAFLKRLAQLQEILLRGVLVVAQVDDVEIEHVPVYLDGLVVGGMYGDLHHSDAAVLEVGKRGEQQGLAQLLARF